MKNYWNKDTHQAIAQNPTKAVEVALRRMGDDVEMYYSLLADLDLHRIIAAKILRKKRKDVTLEERTLCKRYTFYVRYGALGKLPLNIQDRYRKIMPELVKTGENTRAQQDADRAAMLARVPARNNINA